MDPDRVRAYLQVACAGLGFDIGEVWWSSSNESGTSTALAAIEEKHDDSQSLALSNGKQMRFVQLYTSRSYQNRRNQLVTPADEEENYKQIVGDSENNENENQLAKTNKKEHVLSPLLVDAITKTAQVVWAHTKKQEGLTGRSDMRLQTAVGMPVAVDGSGNMCVVVMFSPNNISSTDDALEYLQSISRSATATSIPALLPAFDPKQGLSPMPHHQNTNEMIPLLSQPSMADGSVITRFVSLDNAPIGGAQLHIPEVHSDHELSNAPKDCFGIPMLPSANLFDGSDPLSGHEAFDEASYGVWSTIMENGEHSVLGSDLLDSNGMGSSHFDPSSAGPVHETTGPVYAINKPTMEKERLDRLEEFASAFLDVSVFDFAEVWVPIGEEADHLGQVTSIMSSDSKTNQALHSFEKMSEKTLVKYWSGAVGRAFSSGNPVWSANKDVFVDAGRASLFSQVKIETALAVPVFSGKSNTPSFVFSCYSFVRSGSVPFVLKFVQQALRLLWDGLDKVQPHKSIGNDLWRDVAPADLGEMAADVEMQQHFMIKKRPRSYSTDTSLSFREDPADSALASGFGSLGTPSGFQPVRSIYTGAASGGDNYDDDDFEPNVVVPLHYQPVHAVHSHIQQAVQSVADLKPMHLHVDTNEQGSKRAHVVIERLDSPVEFDTQHSQQKYEPQGKARETPGPLPAPRPLPLPNSSLGHPFLPARSTAAQQTQPGQTPLAAQPQQQYYQMQQPSQPQQEQHHPPQEQRGQYQQHQQYHQQHQQQPQKEHQPYPPQEQHQQYQQHQPQSQQPQYQQQLPQDQHQQYQQHQQQPPHYQAPSQQQPQQSNVMFLNVDGNHGMNMQYQPHVQQSQQVSQQQQPQSTFQQYAAQPGTFSSYSSHDQQTASESTYEHAPLHNPDQGNHHAQAQQHYSSGIQHAENMSFPSDQSGHQQNNFASQNSAPSYNSVPNNKIAANGMVFSLPQTHNNGMQATPIAPNNGDSNQYCQVVNPAPSGHGKSKPCRIQGCNDPAVSRRPYCVRHSGNRMCEHPSCSKCAQGSTRFCIAHGGGRRCTFPGCDKGARDKFFCAAHGGGKRCKQDGCNKSAVGGSQLCTAHGGGRRCSVEGCDKSAQSSTKFCVKHGGGKKCSYEGCEKVARGRTQFCAAHGGGVRCKLAGCNRVAIGKAQLCRAHGGGAGSRKKSSSGSNGSNGNSSMPAAQPMFGGAMGGGSDHQQGSIPGFADMTTV